MDSEGGASESDIVAPGEEGGENEEEEKMEEKKESAAIKEEPTMSQSTSVIMDSATCKHLHLAIFQALLCIGLEV